MANLLSGENDGKVVKEKQSAYSEKFSDAQGEKSAENKEIQKPTDIIIMILLLNNNIMTVFGLGPCKAKANN